MSDGSTQVSVKLEADLREALQREANEDQRPLAWFIRKILRSHVERPKSRARSRVQHQTEVAA